MYDEYLDIYFSTKTYLLVAHQGLLTFVLLNKLRCHSDQSPHPLLIFIQIVDTNSNTEWQTVDPDQLASSEAN